MLGILSQIKILNSPVKVNCSMFHHLCFLTLRSDVGS